MRNALGLGPESLHISSVLRILSPPTSFVIVAGGWPGCLVSLLSLGLPVQGAYFPAKYHAYFNPSRYCATSWKSTVAFRRIADEGDQYVYVLSGSVDFLRCLLPSIGGSQHVIITVDVDWTGAPCSALQRAVRDGHALCRDFGFVPLVVGNAATGGATDSQHFICFSQELSHCHTPMVEPGLRWTVRHVLDGSVEGRLPTVLKFSLPNLSSPALQSYGTITSFGRKVCFLAGPQTQRCIVPCTGCKTSGPSGL